MKSSLYECLFKEIENKLQDQKYQELYGKIKEQNKFAIHFGVIATIAAFIYIWLITTIIRVLLLMIFPSKYIHISELTLGFLFVLVLLMFIVSIAFYKKIRVIEKYDEPNKVIYKLLKIMACDESLYNRFNQILAEIPNKNFAMNILESDFKCESKSKNSPKYDTVKKIFIGVITGVITGVIVNVFFEWIQQQMIQQNIIYLSIFIVIIFTIIVALYAGWSVYKSYYIDLNGALKLYIGYYVTDEYKNC